MMKREIMESIVNLLSNKPSKMSAEEVVNEIQSELDAIEAEKEAKRQARADYVAEVAPKIKAIMASNGNPMTAVEIFTAIPTWGIEGFNSRKITNLFMREMKDEVYVAETNGIRHKYALK